MTRLLPRRAILLAPSAAALLGGTALLVLRDRWRDAPPPGQAAIGGASPLLGQQLPAFALPGLPGKPGFANTDLAASGQPVLLNFFASWCLPCRMEAPVLARLSRRGLAVWGIDYRDQPADAAPFLRESNNPYLRVACDSAGQLGRAFDLIGLPESFLVDRHGVVRWHWAGGVSEDVVRQYLAPRLAAIT